jgi:hypothetical protein
LLIAIPDVGSWKERLVQPSADVRAYYEEQCRRSDEVLAGVSMSERP